MGADKVHPGYGDAGGQQVYHIRVRGKLDESWSDWFGGMTILLEYEAGGSPITTLTGAVADQPQLRGILSRLWDLNLPVVSVYQIALEKKAHERQGGQPWEDC